MARVDTLKDQHREQRQFRARAVAAAAFAVVLLLILIARMVYLQVYSHEHFTTLSTNNRVSLVPLAPTRGLITDRNGVVLAENLPSFSVEIVPERAGDINATLRAVGELLEVREHDLKRFARELKRRRRFEGIPLRFRLSDDEVARLAVNRHRLPGVEVSSRLTRRYPMGALTAHSVGYVGRINEKELKTLDPSNYSATRRVGKTGVELSHEGYLHGKVGHQQVETNARGRVLRVLERTPPVPGLDLSLNIDVRLQRAAEQAFGGERGALVAIEPGSGAVLALVSVPSFDPNLFVNGIDPKSYAELRDSRDQPLFNRALRGQYPPGSTTKPFIGLAGLESDEVEPYEQIHCPGWYQLKGDDHRYRDWKKLGHGETNLGRAIIESCDVYFYDLSLNLGIDRISEYMQRFGFGLLSGIDIGGESRGLMPSREWKRRVKKEPWFPGETLITGIGQGFMLATPLQLASATATLANDGVPLQPMVVRGVSHPGNTGEGLLAPSTGEPVPITDPDHWAFIERAMIKVIHSGAGSARGIQEGMGYTMAGKTGTAQVFTIAQDEEYEESEIAKRLRDHALFIAYAPAEDPRIAVAVVVENGGGGGSVAAPVARRVIDVYLKEQQP